MREIKLSQGKVAIVDDEDYERISKRKWFFHAATGYAMGYVTQGRGRSPVYLHRIILNAAKGDYVDHRSRDKLDNRHSNIRICTQTQNILNSPNVGSGKWTSKYRGVSALRYKWKAAFCNRTLGHFYSEIEAAQAYDAAALAAHPDFVHLNFPQGVQP